MGANYSGRRACVIGAGPNGLAAAIVLAQAGVQVGVYEAEEIPGGAARTMELTLPGFLHDFGSAVHPFAVGSPFFKSLPLSEHGLEWIHSPAPLAHPLDDGSAVVLERGFRSTESWLGRDAKSWRRLIQPLAEHWDGFAQDVLNPIPSFPRHPWLFARFGMQGLLSARAFARLYFAEERTKALFAGLAAHSLISLDEPLTAASGILFAVSAHAVGWPIPRGGSQSLTNALCSYLCKLGGTIEPSRRVDDLRSLTGYDVTLCDVPPSHLSRMAGNRLSGSYRRQLEKYRSGPGVFKVDYALSNPIPWKALECLRAATVHLGGTYEEIAASEKAVRNGQPAERPFILLAQPTLFDPTRAPAGKHIAWAYCHVPNGSGFNMLDRLENQIERFAPGFRDCVLARRVFSPAALEAMDSNLIGGDIAGGTMNLRQMIFRPTLRHYATSARDIYICSASSPPGGGVHGMCGFHAAKLALSRLKS